MHRLAPLTCLMIATLTLVACGTPQEQCSKAVTKDIRTVDILIRETQGNLARGFRYETEYRNTNFGLSLCTGRSNVGFCYDNRGPTTVRRAVAIDPEQEQRKLAALQDQKSSLLQAQCQPNGARIMAKA